jgi:hypothetical protein
VHALPAVSAGHRPAGNQYRYRGPVTGDPTTAAADHLLLTRTLRKPSVTCTLCRCSAALCAVRAPAAALRPHPPKTRPSMLACDEAPTGIGSAICGIGCTSAADASWLSRGVVRIERDLAQAEGLPSTCLRIHRSSFGSRSYGPTYSGLLCLKYAVQNHCTPPCRRLSPPVYLCNIKLRR